MNKLKKIITIHIIIITFFIGICQSEKIKSLIIGSSINSLRHQYIAYCFFSDDEINEVLKNNRVCEIEEDVELIDFLECEENIDLYEIDNAHVKGYAILVYNPLSVKIGYSKNLEHGGEKTSEIAKNSNAIAAINGGGFSCKDNNLKPMGVVIHGGEVIYNELDEDEKQDIVGFTKDGMLIVGKHSISALKKINIQEAVTFGPPLIVNGKKVDIKGDGGWGIAPRTAIGQREDGTVILMTLKGRNIKTVGATLKDIQQEMLKYNAVNASNLDGGNSTTMVYDGEILNKKKTKEIKVPTAIIVERR